MDIGKRLPQPEVESTILQGKGRMPSLPNLKGEYLQALVRFLENGDTGDATPSNQAEDAAKPAPAATASRTPETVGAKAYADKCATCHGDHREGKLPTFSALTNVRPRLSSQQIQDRVHQGKGAMPPFPGIAGTDLDGLVAYLTAEDPVDVDSDKEAIYSSTAEGAPMR